MKFMYMKVSGSVPAGGACVAYVQPPAKETGENERHCMMLERNVDSLVSLQDKW